MAYSKEAAGPALPKHEQETTGRGRYGLQNIVVTFTQIVAWALVLLLLDRVAMPRWAFALGVVLFCMLMQGIFTMMHEFFHKNAHKSARLNYIIGLVGSLAFGTSATLHRVNHWGHHVRNRSEAERGEFIHPDETPVLKVFLYYFSVLGGLWLGGAVFPLVALFIPYGAVQRLARTKRFNTYAAAFEQFTGADWTRMRLEGLLLVTFWGAVLWLGLLRWQTLAVCYAAFAFSWSSLQWVYHLRTPIHVIEGAYNLRAPWLVRVLFLNFNYNLTHHRHPGLPWQELPAHTDVKETQPLWYRWARMLEPPKRFPSDLAAFEKTYLAKKYF